VYVYEIDLTEKVYDKMEKLGQKRAMHNSKLLDRTFLLADSDASDNDVEEARKAIVTMNETHGFKKRGCWRCARMGHALAAALEDDTAERAMMPSVQRTMADVGPVICGNMSFNRDGHDQGGLISTRVG